MDVMQMWEQLNHRRVSEVAKENGLTQQGLVALLDQAGLTGRTEGDPSPEEIAREAERIKSQWDERTKERRWIAARRFSGSEFSYMEGR